MNCVISHVVANQATTSAITDTKLHFPLVTLSTKDNAKILQQLKSRFKSTINCHKYQSKTELLNASNPYLDFLIDPSFQGVNRVFGLPFNAFDNRTGHSRYCLPTAEVKDYNVIVDEKTNLINQFFDQI